MNLDGLITLIISRVGYLPEDVAVEDIAGQFLTMFLRELASFDCIDDDEKDYMASRFVLELHHALSMRKRLEQVARWN